ncbi:MAG: DUF481 domain-containing protein [Paraprevotella sp.]|nr:DUF481 domain-containing protein [Paraprevotella sp.]
MKKFILLCALWSVLGLSSVLHAQQNAWMSYALSFGYENMGHTYERNSYSVALDLETHGRRKIFGNYLLGYSWYEGAKTTTVNYANGPSQERLSDSKIQLFFGVGPGFDLLSNEVDRFYLSLYGGYAIVRYEYDYYEGTLPQSSDEGHNGFGGLARLGYEHQFGSSFTLGGYLQVSYIGSEFNWGVGVRLGYRFSDFHWKNARKAE